MIDNVHAEIAKCAKTLMFKEPFYGLFLIGLNFFTQVSYFIIKFLSLNRSALCEYCGKYGFFFALVHTRNNYYFRNYRNILK